MQQGTAEPAWILAALIAIAPASKVTSIGEKFEDVMAQITSPAKAEPAASAKVCPALYRRPLTTKAPSALNLAISAS